MRVAAGLLLLTAPLALANGNVVRAAVDKANLVARQNSTDPTYAPFNLDYLPASCDTDCTYYKEVFGTCPEDPSNAVCAGVCNQTRMNEWNICMGCFVNTSPPANERDILNTAQQALVQQCVSADNPATFTGTVIIPTVAYPSGVVNATFYGTAKPSTSSAAPSSSSSAAASSVSLAPPASATTKSAAGLGKPLSALGAVVAAMGVAALV